MSNKGVSDKVIIVISAVYASYQTLLAVALSIYGYWFVKNNINDQGDALTASTILSETDSSNTRIHANFELTIDRVPSESQITRKKFLVTWMKVVWKLRSVYASFAVHTFDIATDIIVIITWWYEETDNNDEEHIDTRLMAIISIAIIIFHKILSSSAIWLQQRDVYRVLLQFLDLLIIEEIFHAHKKVIASYNNKSVKDIDSTMTFKYIRSMEAVFESVPQAVLQLVYVMRTGRFDFIFMISTLQSIISMTNSVLKDDNIRGMYGKKWKKYKSRLPPTKEFMQHAMSRLSQVVSRICILSLIWTIVGGLGFTIVCVIEVLFTFIQFIFYDGNSWNDAFLFISTIIIIPPELIFEQEMDKNEFSKTVCGCINGNGCEETCGYFCVGYVFCMTWGALLAKLMSFQSNKYGYQWTSIRLGFSFMEIILIIIFGILDYEYKSKSDNFLFWKWDHSLVIFIICIISYLIDCSYLSLFPDFALPNGISARSRWGYAFAGELTELQKLKIRVSDEDISDFKKTNRMDYSNSNVSLKDEEMKQIYWDKSIGGTCLLYALANKHYHIVEWIKQQGAKDGINENYSCQDARKLIDPEFDGWID